MLKEITADIFNFNEHKYLFRYICVTTNCEFDSSGQAIMGKGIALAAKNLFPDIQDLVTSATKGHKGHIVKIYPKITDVAHPIGFINFPTKIKWTEKSKISLIVQNMIELAAIARNDPFSLYTLPRPGCNNGGLDWEKEVKPIAEKFLDLNNIIIIDNNLQGDIPNG